MTTEARALGTGSSADERMIQSGLLTRVMRRPELGAVAGLVLVGLFFAVFANPAMFTLSGAMT